MTTPHYFHPPYFHPQYQAAVDAAVDALVKQRNIAIENLTREQTADAIQQALASGDFQRCIRVDNDSQAVTYIPFREVETLKAENRRLKEQIEAVRKALE